MTEWVMMVLCVVDADSRLTPEVSTTLASGLWHQKMFVNSDLHLLIHS